MAGLADIMGGLSGFFGGQNQGKNTDIERVTKILQANQDKNFIQRIMKPDISPVLVNYDGPGTHGTHLMSSGEIGGKGIAYPEIVQGKDGNLQRLGRNEASDHAIKTGEHIKFDTPAEAEWFGKNYKSVWGPGYGQPNQSNTPKSGGS